MIEALGEPINSGSYKYDVDSCSFEEHQEPGARPELAYTKCPLLYDHPNNVRHQSKLEKNSHNVFDLNNMDDFCDLGKMLVKIGGHDYDFYTALHFRSRWRRFTPRQRGRRLQAMEKARVGR